MAETKVVKEDAPIVEEISLEDYLKGVDASDLLKGMFVHYLRRIQTVDTTTKAAFEQLFNAFKDMPSDQLR